MPKVRMGRPSTVCSDVPSTSRTAMDSATIETTYDPPPHYNIISNFEASDASTSKQALAEMAATISATTSSHVSTDLKRKPPDKNKQRRTITIDCSFDEECSDDSEESYRSSDEEPDEADRRRPREKNGHSSITFQSALEQHSTSDPRLHVPPSSAVIVSSTTDHESGLRDSTNSTVDRHCYSRGRTFCFGLLMIHSTFFTLFIVDLLLLLYSLIFTITNYLGGSSQYNQPTSTTMPAYAQKIDVEKLIVNVTAIQYDMLLPLFAVQIFWVVSGVAAVVALKMVQPLLQLPYMLISMFLIFISLWFAIRSAVRLIEADPTVADWILALTMALAGAVFAIQFYFLYVKLIYVRALLRKRNAVVSNTINNISSVEAHSSSVHGRNSGGRSSGRTVVRPSSASAIAAAIEARIFRRQRSAAVGEPANQKRQHDKCYSIMTVSTTLDEKSDVKRPPQDIDCCSCTSCCCDETYSTKSTVIVTDNDEEIKCQKY